ncbi:hypothetical protein NC652_009981 [Populus alba x Populus x berolinensis]|nr:hypothetical protein NC652_009981 [Populus alba x Populus x berolinensis]
MRQLMLLGGFFLNGGLSSGIFFIARTNEKHSETAAAYLEAQQSKTKEQQQLQMQHFQLMHHAQLQRGGNNNPTVVVR